MSKTLKNGEVEKLKTGTVIHGDGSAAKMEVEETEVKSEGDYRESPQIGPQDYIFRLAQDSRNSICRIDFLIL